MTREQYIKLYGSEEAVAEEMARRSKGNKGPRKHSDEVVEAIRASDESLAKLAAKYGMNRSMVWKIKTGKIRK